MNHRESLLFALLWIVCSAAVIVGEGQLLTGAAFLLVALVQLVWSRRTNLDRPGLAWADADAWRTT